MIYATTQVFHKNSQRYETELTSKKQEYASSVQFNSILYYTLDGQTHQQHLAGTECWTYCSMTRGIQQLLVLKIIHLCCLILPPFASYLTANSLPSVQCTNMYGFYQEQILHCINTFAISCKPATAIKSDFHLNLIKFQSQYLSDNKHFCTLQN